MERINPFSDFGFKRIFGQEESKALLVDFLNSMLAGEKEIVDLVYRNTEQQPEHVGGKLCIYDVYCTTADNEHIIVEMQFKKQANFKERALYYLSRAIANQGERGDTWKFHIDAVYGVFFMDFRFNESSKFRTDVVLSDRDTGDLFSDKLRQVFLELPQFTKTESECITPFDRWIYTLKHMENLKTIPFQRFMTAFQQLEKVTNLASLSKEERESYDQSLKIYRDNLAVVDFAEKQARAEGIAKEKLKEKRKEKPKKK